MKGYNRLSHAYIADGDAVDILAMAAVCSGAGDADKPCRHCKNCDKAERRIHPDMHTVEVLKDKKGIIVDQIRSLQADLPIIPNDASRKIYIIKDAHTMNASAQNALLLMLEEPPPHVVFILQTSNPQALFETIRSRCVMVRNVPNVISEGAHPHAESVQLADEFAAALNDNLLLTECMFKLDSLEREALTEFIALTRERLAKQLRNEHHREKALHALDLLTEAARMQELNVNSGHISGMLCASLMG